MSELGDELTDEEVQELMEQADKDGDGYVCYKGESIGLCIVQSDEAIGPNCSRI